MIELHGRFIHHFSQCDFLITLYAYESRLQRITAVPYYDTQMYYVNRLRNVRTESELQMEALLEERIQLLQDRMKAITAQREQIEQANRGLEEELDKSVPIFIFYNQYNIIKCIPNINCHIKKKE